ncbi:MAG TPA: PEP-CTERM sorting domain-containing protein [Chthoniobacterales bacterium]|nr:PEP-CTERM sorting domain-containing protein [Chthoniobacterales bacterium]
MKTGKYWPALLVLLAFSAWANAQNTFIYDFENLTSGQDLVNQDGWMAVSTWFSPIVGAGPGVNPTLTVRSPSVQNAVGAQRSVGSTFTYTSADTNVQWQFDGIGAGVATQLHFLGITFGYQGGSYLRIANDQELFGDSLLASDWYQFRLSVDFSVPGVSASLSYRDLTAGSLTFIQDGTLQNINLGLTPNGLGQYQASTVLIRMDSNFSTSYLDNINLGAVPEPSTYAMGLLGAAGSLLHLRRRNFRNDRG